MNHTLPNNRRALYIDIVGGVCFFRSRLLLLSPEIGSGNRELSFVQKGYGRIDEVFRCRHTAGIILVYVTRSLDILILRTSFLDSRRIWLRQSAYIFQQRGGEIGVARPTCWYCCTAGWVRGMPRYADRRRLVQDKRHEHDGARLDSTPMVATIMVLVLVHDDSLGR